MKDIALMLLSCAVWINFSYAQVGIGTRNPTSQLEIATTNTGIPAIEINPQSTPLGTSEGQLAVMGDVTNGYKLYMYDDVRGKWLSVETSTLTLGRNSNQDNTNLRATANQGNTRSGYLMPFDGTIVHVTAKSNDNSGAQAKQLSS